MKGLFGKLIIGLIIVLNITFTCVVLWIFYKTGNEPVALVGAFFAFTTGELWLLATIKKTKVKEHNDD